MSRLGMVVLTGLLACCGTRSVGVPASGAHAGTDETARPVETAGPAADAGPRIDPSAALSEAAARVLLASRFRAAGLRVLYDVTIQNEWTFDVTLDGYDPDRRIGFEYVDPAERDVDLTPAEREALAASPDLRVLVVDAMTTELLLERVDRFLADIVGDAKE